MAKRTKLNLIPLMTYVTDEVIAFVRKEAYEITLKEDGPMSVSKVVARILEEEMARRSAKQANKQ
jgi:hypothetical protein